MAHTVFERSKPPRSAVESALADSVHGVFWIEDADAPRYPRLSADSSCDLVIVGGGYAGLWTAVLAKERDPDARVILLEAKRIGWAASGRNGGFCEPSITHGHDNGASRWPQEIDTLDRLGVENLDEIEQTVARYAMDVEFERTGSLSVAVEPHQLDWLDGEVLGTEAVRAMVNSPTYLGGAFDPDPAMVHPYKLAVELARVATELGVEIYEDTVVMRVGAGPMVLTPAGTVRAAKVALATNAFPSLLRRNALMTVPVYDYVLMTQPLTEAQLAEIGWDGRFGIADLANQFHYYRLTADNRILFGGYDAVYHFGAKIRAAYEQRPETYLRLASHFLTTFPQLEGIAFTHRWAGVIDTCSRFSAFFGTARGGTVAYALGYTGLGVGATRFGANVMLDLLEGEPTERTELEMVRTKPLPFPPEPLTSLGVALTKSELDRADHNQGRRGLFLRALDAVGMGFDS